MMTNMKNNKGVNMNGSIDELYELINSIPVTKENERDIKDIKKALENNDFAFALEKLERLSFGVKNDNENKVDEIEENKNAKKTSKRKSSKKEEKVIYPKELSNIELEHVYMKLLLENPEAIVKYYFLFNNCFFEDQEVLTLYKRVLFTDGEAYATEIAKRGFNFPRENEATEKLENELKEMKNEKGYSIEKAYIELQKLFVLRKNYKGIPIKAIQDKVVEIANYKLYDQMSIAEVESAIEQVNDTEKFKRAVLTDNLTAFLEANDSILTNGLELPFPILSSVFKGIRKGETMSFAMPSNAGKSRFTINLATYTAFVHKKKVLVISNEMSEEKMKLCLITTILNNPVIQKMHKQTISKTEGELLEFKFRPDNVKDANVDKDGFVIREEKESQKDFVKKLTKISTEFNKTIAVTEWANEQIANSIYFINITDHTNDELRKVIMNYYYKEKIEYVFYDTLKTDIDNIGNGEELKKTATILSNLAQNFNMFICSTLQLTESTTSPINLNVNDLAVSRTVKEVLDTLCLIKQINVENFNEYEYSEEELDTKFYDIEKPDDTDVRYYACVVDKNRAGAKPKILFKLNLAYNSWEELGYLRLKQTQEK